MQQFFMSRTTSLPDRNTQEFLTTYACSPRLPSVTKIAADLSNVPGKLFRIAASGDKDEITDHPFLGFMAYPNSLPFMTRSALWKVHETYLIIKGEGAAIIECDAVGYPVELWSIPLHWMTDIPRLDFPYYTIRSRDGLQATVPVEDVFLAWQLNPLDPYGRGLGGAEAVVDEIETDEYMAKRAKKLFWNDVTPPIFMSAPNIMQDEYNRFKVVWDDWHRGVDNMHKMGIIPRGVTVNKLVDSQREMDFMQSHEDLRDGVNTHFGVSSETLGTVENSNRATATQAKIIYAGNVPTPRLLVRQDAINMQLLSAWGEGLLWEYDDIAPKDTGSRLQMSNAGLSGSAITMDEWREQNGFDPLPSGMGQVLFVPYASIPTKPEELTQTMRESGGLTPSKDLFPSSGTPPETLTRAKGVSRRRQQIVHRDRMQALLTQERVARQTINRFFTSQLSEIIAAMESGRKDASENFRQRISGGQGLTFDVTVIRAAVMDALSQLIDWNQQDEVPLRMLSSVWEEAFNTGTRPIEQNFGATAVRTPCLTGYLHQQDLKRIHGVNETTRNKIVSMPASGIEVGGSIVQLVKRIQQHLFDMQAGCVAAVATSKAHISIQASSFVRM